jgi:hypothetical protein
VNALAAAAAGFSLGVFLGAVFGVAIYERATRRAYAVTRTGRPGTPEQTANREIARESIEKGADILQESAAAQGMRISRKKALEDAEQMLRTADPLGGVV